MRSLVCVIVLQCVIIINGDVEREISLICFTPSAPTEDEFQIRLQHANQIRQQKQHQTTHTLTLLRFLLVKVKYSVM